MGHGSWDANDYKDRASKVVKDHGTIHKHDADVKSGRASGVHKDLNPKGLTFRESCDSATSPESRAIIVCYDVTGSMGTAPSRMQPKFPGLMGLIMATAGIQNPHLMMMCIGDAEMGDRYPLQVGQFEITADTISSMLENMIIEGGGGGNLYESYDLALYVAARKTKIDCYDKRGVKGYFFTIGDEKIQGRVSKNIIQEVIGDTLEADIPIEDLIKEVQEKYEYFHIIPVNEGTGSYKDVQERWKSLLGERVLHIDKVENIAELISATIASLEGVSMSKIDTDLQAAGLVLSSSVKSAITKVSGSVTKVGTSSLPSTTNKKNIPTV